MPALQAKRTVQLRRRCGQPPADLLVQRFPIALDGLAADALAGYEHIDVAADRVKIRRSAEAGHALLPEAGDVLRQRFEAAPSRRARRGRQRRCRRCLRRTARLVRAPWRVQLVPGKASIALIAVLETGDPRYSWINKVSRQAKVSCPPTRHDSTTKSTSSDKRRVSATAASLCARVSIGAINGKSAPSHHDQEPNKQPCRNSAIRTLALWNASRAA